MSEVSAGGSLAANIVHFARALRRAGLAVGPAEALQAARAVAAGGLGGREDVYHALRACLIARPEHRAVFERCFDLFWRDPQLFERAPELLLPQLPATAAQPPKPGEARAGEALGQSEPKSTPGQRAEIDAALSLSSDEVLRTRDFEQMSTAEATAAKLAIARLSLPVKPIATRRTQPSARGSLPDWRASMRTSLRQGAEPGTIAYRKRRQRWPALVALCDISGSMAAYSRMLLHFLHAAANAKGAGWSKVHAFTFATELSDITRHLRTRDPDDALRRAGAEARDWQGGTRIGACLERFNRDWSRRVLGQGAVVLLITDGLEREDPALLGKAAEHLSLSCRRLIWLNPLLRWEGFEARAGGVRALLPHVDSFRSAHSIASLEALSSALSYPEDSGEKARLLAAMVRQP
ncbi:MAG: VWA domain-containing protein [Pseudomonadota bacterium]